MAQKCVTSMCCLVGSYLLKKKALLLCSFSVVEDIYICAKLPKLTDMQSFHIIHPPHGKVISHIFICCLQGLCQGKSCSWALHERLLGDLSRLFMIQPLNYSIGYFLLYSKGNLSKMLWMSSFSMRSAVMFIVIARLIR